MESAAERGDPHAQRHLRAPPRSWRTDDLLLAYFEYSEFRRADGQGEHLASWLDLQAWCAMTGREPLTAWERRVFRRIDIAYFNAMRDGASAQEVPPSARPRRGGRSRG